MEDIINEIIAVKYEERCHKKKEINGETKFIDLNFDSLNVMEVIIEGEGKLHKKVDDDKIVNIRTVSDLYRLFEETK